MHVQNLGYPFPLQIGGPKPPFLANLQLKGKFNGLYLRNEIRYTQVGKCVANYKYKGAPRSSQNDINFGPQTASNWTVVFTHIREIPHYTSLPGFADRDQQTELNHTLSNGGW